MLRAPSQTTHQSKLSVSHHVTEQAFLLCCSAVCMRTGLAVNKCPRAPIRKATRQRDIPPGRQHQPVAASASDPKGVPPRGPPDHISCTPGTAWLPPCHQKIGVPGAQTGWRRRHPVPKGAVWMLESGQPGHHLQHSCIDRRPHDLLQRV